MHRSRWIWPSAGLRGKMQWGERLGPAAESMPGLMASPSGWGPPSTVSPAAGLARRATAAARPSGKPTWHAWVTLAAGDRPARPAPPGTASDADRRGPHSAQRRHILATPDRLALASPLPLPALPGQGGPLARVGDEPGVRRDQLHGIHEADGTSATGSWGGGHPTPIGSEVAEFSAFNFGGRQTWQH